MLRVCSALVLAPLALAHLCWRWLFAAFWAAAAIGILRVALSSPSSARVPHWSGTATIALAAQSQRRIFPGHRGARNRYGRPLTLAPQSRRLPVAFGLLYAGSIAVPDPALLIAQAFLTIVLLFAVVGVPISCYFLGRAIGGRNRCRA